MFNLNKILVALFAISSCNTLFGESSIKSELDDINKQLVATVQTTDLEANLKALEELVHKKAEKGFHCNPFSKFGNKALKTLVSLADNKCDNVYFNDLKNINEALNNEAHGKNLPILRIKRVAHDLSMKHAKECQNTYYKTFESKVANQDQNFVNNVKVFYDSFANLQTVWNSGCWILETSSIERLFEQIQWRKSCNWRNHKYEIYKALTLLTKGSDDSKYLKKIDNEISGTRQINKTKLRAVFEKYLVNSCKYYVNHFGPEVFAPAMYDAEMHHEVDESKADFYFGMAHYKLCSQFLPDERNVFENLLETANDRS